MDGGLATSQDINRFIHSWIIEPHTYSYNFFKCNGNENILNLYSLFNGET